MRFDREISATIDLEATPADVWHALEPIEHHVDWMADAVAIRFHTDQRGGVRTRFTCDTRIGPLRLRDEMEIVTWAPGAEMGVVHRGLVTGSGSFHLAAIDRGRRCRLTWSETLSFPWWMGGPIGAWAGACALGWTWRGNLRRFRDLLATAGRSDAIL